uniref:Uncharacterized protein n=1 Tax=Pyramimonas obovata TaxID=1411642 RepID=A0A7S0WNK6_9CHLO|mmetsp:Transcript_32235/g.70332  ORF Transcript_32235/g.70332 Transcript_32235/m.70332 type:complete len:253 (+) Transcript_32235:56-814(+)
MSAITMCDAAYRGLVHGVTGRISGTQQLGSSLRSRHNTPRLTCKASYSSPDEPSPDAPPPKKRGRPRKSESLDLVEPEQRRGRSPSANRMQAGGFLDAGMKGGSRDFGVGLGSLDMDDMLEPLADDAELYYDMNPSPKVEITAEKGSISEKIQRVLSFQPEDPEFYPEKEMLELELYIKAGGGNRYNLVKGIAARARLEEEQQMHSPTALGDKTKPINRAICSMAAEMEANGGTLSDIHVTHPPQYFKRYVP